MGDGIRRFLPGLILGLVILLGVGTGLYLKGFRLMQHASLGPTPPATTAKEGRKIKHWVSSMDPKYVSEGLPARFFLEIQK
jgi:hypothetical protein